jgi:coenzyme F420-reducing hydrogenase alpha subunit
MKEELNPDYICKIEGHGNLDIKFDKCEARLNILEGERLFEGMLIGRPLTDAPFITSRICGICPTVHYLTSVCALENALKIKVSKETELLRRVLLAGQIIQSHTLHLFFLALPDYLSIDSAPDIAKKYPAEFHIALNLKKFSDKLIEILAGRAVHPISPAISGFDKTPSKKGINGLISDAENVIDEAEDTVKLFAQLTYPFLERKTQYLASKEQNEYTIYNASKIGSSTKNDFKTINYDKNIKEVVNEYSTAKFGTKEKKGFMVGALARININGGYLNQKVKRIVKDLSLVFPSYNPFHNNLAQAIEILHFMEDIVIFLKQLLASDLEKTKVFDYKVRAGYSVGVCEAPRGTLYHAYEINNSGLITKCDIITPTAQNLTNIEEDAKRLLKETQGLNQKKRQQLLEMLVRAYDPCITCSVH